MVRNGGRDSSSLVGHLHSRDLITQLARYSSAFTNITQAFAMFTSLSYHLSNTWWEWGRRNTTRRKTFVSTSNFSSSQENFLSGKLSSLPATFQALGVLLSYAVGLALDWHQLAWFSYHHHHHHHHYFFVVIIAVLYYSSGTNDTSKMDELSLKVQTSFDPSPLIFIILPCRFFVNMLQCT